MFVLHNSSVEGDYRGDAGSAASGRSVLAERLSQLGIDEIERARTIVAPLDHRRQRSHNRQHHHLADENNTNDHHKHRHHHRRKGHHLKKHTDGESDRDDEDDSKADEPEAVHDTRKGGKGRISVAIPRVLPHLTPSGVFETPIHYDKDTPASPTLSSSSSSSSSTSSASSSSSPHGISGKKKKNLLSNHKETLPQQPLFYEGHALRILYSSADGRPFINAQLGQGKPLALTLSSVTRTLTLASSLLVDQSDIQVDASEFVCCITAKRCQQYCGAITMPVCASTTTRQPVDAWAARDFHRSTDRNGALVFRERSITFPRYQYYVSDTATFHRMGLLGTNLYDHLRLRTDAVSIVHGKTPMICFGQYVVFPDQTPRIPLMPGGNKRLPYLPLIAIDVIAADGSVFATNRCTSITPALFDYGRTVSRLPQVSVLKKQLIAATGGKLTFQESVDSTKALLGQMPRIRFRFDARKRIAGSTGVGMEIPCTSSVEMLPKDYMMGNTLAFAWDDNDEQGNHGIPGITTATTILSNRVFRNCDIAMLGSHHSFWVWDHAL